MSFLPANLKYGTPFTIPGGKVPNVPQTWNYYANFDTIQDVLSSNYFGVFADFATSLNQPELVE